MTLPQLSRMNLLLPTTFIFQTLTSVWILCINKCRWQQKIHACMNLLLIYISNTSLQAIHSQTIHVIPYCWIGGAFPYHCNIEDHPQKPYIKSYVLKTTVTLVGFWHQVALELSSFDCTWLSRALEVMFYFSKKGYKLIIQKMETNSKSTDHCAVIQ